MTITTKEKVNKNAEKTRGFLAIKVVRRNKKVSAVREENIGQVVSFEGIAGTKCKKTFKHDSKSKYS